MPPPKKIKIKQEGYRCLRCGHEWVPRQTGKPRVCPAKNCHSPYWDIPRKDTTE